MLSESTIRDIAKFTTGNEGRYSNHPNDKGGVTYWGISEAYAKSKGIKLPVTRKQAEDILINDAMRHGIFEVDEGMAYFLFDAGTLFGFDRIVRWFQRCVVICGGGAIVVDGVIGPKTLSAYAKCDKRCVLERLHEMVTSYHKSVAMREYKQAVFLRGWLNRADKRYKKALEYL